MDKFEHDLKAALTRRDPPAWFEARVLAAANANRHSGRAGQPAGRAGIWSNWFSLPVRAVAAVILPVMLAGGLVWQHQRGEAAKAKLELALKVTRIQLQRIQQQVDAIEEGN